MTHKIDGPMPPVNRPSAARTDAVGRAGAPRNGPVDAAPAVDEMRLTGEAESIRALAREASGAGAPIDQAKVEAIRAQLATGSYRIDPQQIAQRLTALEREMAG